MLWPEYDEYDGQKTRQRDFFSIIRVLNRALNESCNGTAIFIMKLSGFLFVSQKQSPVPNNSKGSLNARKTLCSC